MTLAFGLFAPIGAVTYYVLEDILGLNHDLVKWTHATIKFGALLCSILGFIQIYYSNGAWCSFAHHFRSLHSFIGIIMLVGWWLQWPAALLVFSNKVLLKPGTAARKLFMKGHVVVGNGLGFLGLVVIILGIEAFEVKRDQWNDSNASWLSNATQIWNRFAWAGMIAFALLVTLYTVNATKPAPGLAAVKPETPNLLPEEDMFEPVPSMSETARAQSAF